MSSLTITGADGADTFSIDGSAAAAGIALSIDGAGGGAQLFIDGAGRSFEASALGSGAGSLTLDDTTIGFARVGSVDVQGVGEAARIVLGGSDDSDVELGPCGTPSCLALTGSAFGSLQFALPVSALTIDGAAGRDTITLAGALGLGPVALTILAEKIVAGSGVSLRSSEAIVLAAAEGVGLLSAHGCAGLCASAPVRAASCAMATTAVWA